MVKWLLPGCFRQRTLIVHLTSRTMENTFLLGRILFFCAMGFFGIPHFVYSTSIAAPLLGPPWVLAGDSSHSSLAPRCSTPARASKNQPMRLFTARTPGVLAKNLPLQSG